MPHQPDIRRYLKHGTLPQLRAFEASARLGSLTRAAEELHMAQATASVQIKKLSETVGLALFEQVGQAHPADRGWPAGLRRLQRGIPRPVRHGARAGRDARRGVAGAFGWRVPASAGHFAARLLDAFVQRNPGVQASLQVHDRLSADRRLQRQRGRPLHVRRAARRSGRSWRRRWCRTRWSCSRARSSACAREGNSLRAAGGRAVPDARARRRARA